MAKQIMQSAPTSNTAERHSAKGTNVPAYEAVVFKRATAAPELEQSETIALPGRHASAPAAWAAVFDALRAGGGDMIGGEIRQLAS